MKFSNKSLIYLYDDQKEGQQLALNTLNKLQHYQVTEINLNEPLTEEKIEFIYSVVSQSKNFSTNVDEFMEQIRNQPAQVKTPMILSVEKTIQVTDNDGSTFEEQIDWLNN